MVLRAGSREDILDSLLSASDSFSTNSDHATTGTTARPSKFRFKSTSSSTKHKRDNDTHHTHRRRHHHHSERRRPPSTAPTTSVDDPTLYDDTYLPNTRSTAYKSPRQESLDPNRAFQESLFDAIADDEGAAYWEGVYSQPIHVYSREYRSPETGTLERMTDDEYAEYVKLKMWEKKNPHLIRAKREAERREKERGEERERAREAEKRRRKRTNRESENRKKENEDFWERLKREDDRWASGKRKKRESSVSNSRSSDDEYATRTTSRRSRTGRKPSRWERAWKRYLEAWNVLSTTTTANHDPVHTHIPWPTQAGTFNGVDEASVKDFYQNANEAVKKLPEMLTRGGLLKAERFRWHPDKIRHKFGGDKVDDETMKAVNMVSQTINALLEENKLRS
ncbi:hypothetical protein LTR66_008824 [Elasticomyces elasticus]|nr:hypothetical protein LTR66_008824 [Elasticomyces elasticus]